MSILNSLILFDSFISSGREFQILGPKNTRDCILYGVNARQTVVLFGRKLALTNHNEDNVVITSCVLEY